MGKNRLMLPSLLGSPRSGKVDPRLKDAGSSAHVQLPSNDPRSEAAAPAPQAAPDSGDVTAAPSTAPSTASEGPAQSSVPPLQMRSLAAHAAHCAPTESHAAASSSANRLRSPELIKSPRLPQRLAIPKAFGIGSPSLSRDGAGAEGPAAQSSLMHKPAHIKLGAGTGGSGGGTASASRDGTGAGAAAADSGIVRPAANTTLGANTRGLREGAASVSRASVNVADIPVARLEETGVLVLHLKGAKGLKRGEIRLLGGAPEAYVEVSAAAGRRRITSSTASSSLGPAWDEELRIEATGPPGARSDTGGEHTPPLSLGDLLQSPLLLDVYDRDTGRLEELFSSDDDKMGALSVPLLPELAISNHADFDLRLPRPWQGTLSFSLHWQSAAPSPAAAAPVFAPPGTPVRPMDTALQHAITIDWAARGVGDDGCHEIERAWDLGGGLRQLVRLNLRACKVGDVGLCVLARVAAQGAFRHLVRMDLSRNQIGDLGVAALAEALAGGGFPNLCDLRLSHNQFGDEGLERLAIALCSSSLLAPIREIHIARHRGSVEGRIALETAASGRRALVKPAVTGYVTLATPCGSKIVAIPGAGCHFIEDLIYIFLDTATGCLRCFSPVGPVTGIGLPAGGVFPSDPDGGQGVAAQRHDFGHALHSAVDVLGKAVTSAAVPGVEATTTHRGIDGGAPAYTGRLTGSGAVHMRGGQMPGGVHSTRAGRATSSVHTIKAYADAARLATARRPRAETLAERWDRWLLDWMLWSEAHKLTFNLTPGLNAARGTRPQLGRRHTAGPTHFRTT